SDDHAGEREGDASDEAAGRGLTAVLHGLAESGEERGEPEHAESDIGQAREEPVRRGLGDIETRQDRIAGRDALRIAHDAVDAEGDRDDDDDGPDLADD